MNIDLSKYNNNQYNPGKPLFIRTLWYFLNIIIFKNPFFIFSSIKINILKIFGTKIKGHIIIKPCINIKYPWLLEIGKNSWIGENVWIDNLALVKIGDNVCISQNAYLLTGNHDYKKTSFDLIVKGIEIKKGAWIGAKSIVCPGVICEEYSILTVGSVAVSNLVENGIYQGNPATFKRKRAI